MIAPNLPQPPVAYDFRDQVEMRRLLAQAFAQSASAGADPALLAQVAALQTSVNILFNSLTLAGIAIAGVPSADFSVNTNSGYLTLFSLGAN